MEIILPLTIFGLILSMIWNLYNTILNWRQNKRYKTNILRLSIKKRLFRDKYDLTKDLTSRMEFTETEKKDYYTVYKFKIREKNGKEYLSTGQQRISINRIGLLEKEILKECDYKGSGVKMTDFERARIKATIEPDFVTIPNDKLPENIEEIKTHLKEMIIERAKENGIKIKRD